MKLLCIKDKKGRDVHLACDNIEAIIRDSDELVTIIVMNSGAEYGVIDTVEHIKERIAHCNAATDVVPS